MEETNEILNHQLILQSEHNEGMEQMADIVIKTIDDNKTKLEDIESVLEHGLLMTDQIVKAQQETNDLLKKQAVEVKDVEDYVLLNVKIKKGDKGEKGDNGEVGEKGGNGSDGKDGVTPVKGVDYFTKEEIETISNEIINSIPRPKDGKDGKSIDFNEVVETVVKLIPKESNDEIKKSIIETSIILMNQKVEESMKGLTLKSLKGQDDLVTKRDLLNAVSNIVTRNISSKTVSLSELNDVSLSGLQKDSQGRYILGAGGASTFSELTDVEIVDILDRDKVRYNSINEKWENLTFAPVTVTRNVNGNPITIQVRNKTYTSTFINGLVSTISDTRQTATINRDASGNFINLTV